MARFTVARRVCGSDESARLSAAPLSSSASAVVPASGRISHMAQPPSIASRTAVQPSPV